MENKEGAEAPTIQMHPQDRELFINQFNASGKIWEILPKQFDCANITGNCLSCKDGETNITLCSECDFVMFILESGEPQQFTPFEILIEIVDGDPITWLINEGWFTTVSTRAQLHTQQVGKVSYFSNPISNINPDKEILVGEVYEYIRGEILKDVTAELREIKKLDEKNTKSKKENVYHMSLSAAHTREGLIKN